MPIASPTPLHEQTYSLEHDRWVELLATTQNLLLIQDLDGVCMGLVKDPLNRVISTDYVEATKGFEGHFYVLTNGEHVGQRGINGIIERAFGDADQVRAQRHYLPGLAAGGVQWQTRSGDVDHPGVSEAELSFFGSGARQNSPATAAVFLSSILGCCPIKTWPLVLMLRRWTTLLPRRRIFEYFSQPVAGRHGHLCCPAARDASVYGRSADRGEPAGFGGIPSSSTMPPIMVGGLTAKKLSGSAQGKNRAQRIFNFMLRGAIKEAGVLALLNRYYGQQTDTYPPGQRLERAAGSPQPSRVD